MLVVADAFRPRESLEIRPSSPRVNDEKRKIVGRTTPPSPVLVDEDPLDLPHPEGGLTVPIARHEHEIATKRSDTVRRGQDEVTTGAGNDACAAEMPAQFKTRRDEQGADRRGVGCGSCARLDLDVRRRGIVQTRRSHGYVLGAGSQREMTDENRGNAGERDEGDPSNPTLRLARACRFPMRTQALASHSAPYARDLFSTHQHALQKCPRPVRSRRGRLPIGIRHPSAGIVSALKEPADAPGEVSRR